MSKYYAVAKGKNPGIFQTWEEAKSMVNGFPGAKYKSFKTYQEAQDYINGYNNNVTGERLITNKTTSIAQSAPVKQIIEPPKINETKIVVYTDGSCVDKIGGLGYIIINKGVITNNSAKVPMYPCTNQIAELYAIYVAIYSLINSYRDEIIKNGFIIYTDSMYSIGCLTEWHHTWSRNGWINSKGEAVANKELIQAILYISKDLIIEYRHVRGHKGNYYNELADRLANDGRIQ
jgi:ribonuclease HI